MAVTLTATAICIAESGKRLSMKMATVRGEKERASKYDIQNRNSCSAYWCGGVAYRCISVLVRNYVDVRGAK